MPTRTIKALGKAYATSGNVSLVINFNGSQVFSGEVPTTNTAPPQTPNAEPVELANWTADTSVSGNVAMSIAVSGGTLHFCDLSGNYTGYELQDSDNDGNPDVVANAYVVVTSVANYYSDLNNNTASSDGKSNVSITNDEGDGQVRNPQTAEEEEGEWVYSVPDGETITFDFTIDSNKLVTTIPTP